MHRGIKAPIFFWRDKTGNEIDLIIENGQELVPFEIKSSKTFNSSFTDTLEKWFHFKDNKTKTGTVIYNGDTLSTKGTISILSWQDIL